MSPAQDAVARVAYDSVQVTGEPTIMLVDDEESIQKLLTYPLQREGYRVVQARDGEEALRRFSEQPVDLVVLDVMLPRLDGLEVCRRLRTESAVPIIMLTARDDEVDKVLGLELGADDYITKPFSIREFRSRIRAVLRRATLLAEQREQTDGAIMTDGLMIDPAKRAVTVAGASVQLTYVEFEVLHTLARTAAGSTRASRCSRPSGATRPTASRARSTSTSATCGRRSSPTRASRPSSSPCAAWATASATGVDRARHPLAAAPAGGGAHGGGRVCHGGRVPVRRPQPAPDLISDRLTGLERIARAQQVAPGMTHAFATGVHMRRALLRSARLANGQAGAYTLANGTLTPVTVVNLPVLARTSTVVRAAARGRIAPGRTPGGGVVVAFRVGDDGVVLLSQSVGDVNTAAALVERQILIATGLALAVAVVVGWALAVAVSRRVGKLESASSRIAAGRFDQPIGDEHPDELGRLARSFDLMQDRLAQVDRARKDFIANASHELRTPLFSLGGFLELLSEEDLDPATREEFVLTMREQVSRLTKLATDLLDLSRLDSGAVEVGSEPVDLAAAARGLVREFRGLAARHGSRVVLARPPSGLPHGIGDEQRVQQIGRVLVDNAVRHNPVGTEVRVSRGCRRRPRQPDRVGRRARDRPRFATASVRALLARAPGQLVGQRPRPGHRGGARPAHGRRDRRLLR